MFKYQNYLLYYDLRTRTVPRHTPADNTQNHGRIDIGTLLLQTRRPHVSASIAAHAARNEGTKNHCGTSKNKQMRPEKRPKKRPTHDT